MVFGIDDNRFDRGQIQQRLEFTVEREGAKLQMSPSLTDRPERCQSRTFE